MHSTVRDKGGAGRRLKFEDDPDTLNEMSHYLKTVWAVVLFAKVRGLAMLESPRIRRVRGLCGYSIFVLVHKCHTCNYNCS